MWNKVSCLLKETTQCMVISNKNGSFSLGSPGIPGTHDEPKECVREDIKGLETSYTL